MSVCSRVDSSGRVVQECGCVLLMPVHVYRVCTASVSLPVCVCARAIRCKMGT